jgi:hypothetical protein
MAVYDIELLTKADEAYEDSVKTAAQRLQELQAAKHQEAVTLEQRVERYSEAFAGGIVIERIVDPESVTFITGYRDSWNIEDGPESDYLDDQHAKSLEGAYASEVRVNDYDLRMGRNSSDLKLHFEVAGIHTNTEVDEDLFWPGDDPTSTEYSGKLRAIEWRLPTEDEVRAFGSLATQAA